MAPVGSETKPLMLPLPAWAKAALPAQRTRIKVRRMLRTKEESALLFFMAISRSNASIQTFEFCKRM
jgi:hypothetical protein